MAKVVEDFKKEVFPEKKKIQHEKLVSITFRENRKFDLHVGRKIKVFRGRETKQIPVSWLKHPDFAQAKKYFIIKGV